MEGYKPLCFCVLQLDNDRGAFALRSIVLNVSPLKKNKTTICHCLFTT